MAAAFDKFRTKVKQGAYKFGAFMHWIFFKPQTSTPEDPAQTSFAPKTTQDAGASAADVASGSMNESTMAATPGLVDNKSGPSEQQILQHTSGSRPPV